MLHLQAKGISGTSQNKTWTWRRNRQNWKARARGISIKTIQFQKVYGDGQVTNPRLFNQFCHNQKRVHILSLTFQLSNKLEQFTIKIKSINSVFKNQLFRIKKKKAETVDEIIIQRASALLWFILILFHKQNVVLSIL